MDNINEILATDLLKRYVIGNVSPEERMKVDLLLIDHAVVRNRMRELEIEVEKEALKDSVTPPADLRSAIVKQLHPNQPHLQSAIEPSQRASIFKNILSYAAAALIGGLAMWLSLNPSLQQAKNELTETENELTKLTADCDQLSNMYAFINDGETRPMLLTGDAFKKEAEVVIYWNEIKSTAMMRVVNLPSIKANQTYQLWADVDGKMLDLGIFDPALAIVDPIKIGYLDNATSLNITVEPSGGSEHPTVSTLTAAISI